MNDKEHFFKDEYEKLIKSLLFSEPPLEYFDIPEMWQAILDINKEKRAFGDENTEISMLSKMYIIEYFYFSAAIGHSEEYLKIQMIFQGLLTNIANTAFSVYKLAFDGLSYQAKVLNRSLYELCMTLLNVMIDKEKRKALFESASKDNEYEVWKRHFSARKLKSTMLAYEKKLGGDFSKDWHERTYKHLSAYVHNDFVNFYFGSMSNPTSDNEELKINYAGNFADRVDNLLEEMNAILFYTGMNFLKMLVDDDLDVKKEHLCTNDPSDSNNKDFWNQASFLELWNRECYIKLLNKQGISI